MELVAISPFFWLILFIWILSLFFLVSLARGLQVLFIFLKNISREGNGNPLQYSCLEIPLNRGTWWAIVHGVAESDTTEGLTHTNNWDTWWCKDILYLLFHLLQEAGWGRKHLGGRMACHTHSSGSLGGSVPATAGLGQIKD